MKRIVIFMLVMFTAAAMIYANAEQEASGSAEAEPIVLTFSHMNAVGTPTDLSSNKFKELVEAKTNGKVEVRVHPAGQLGDDKQNIEGIKLGTIDIAYNNPESLSNLIPEFSAFALPYIFSGYDHVAAAMDGPVGQGLEEVLLEKEDIRLLSWFHNGFRDMLTIKKEIHTLDDFKGVKFRSPQIPVYVMMFEALGAVPTPIPWTEVYTAMKSKIVDGMETTPQGMYNEKMYEVANYVIKTRHLFTADIIIMNEKKFQELPADVQDAIIEAAAEVEVWQREMAINNNEGVYEKLQAEGMTVIDLTPDVKADLRDACRSVWTELSKDTPRVMELADEISALAN